MDIAGIAAYAAAWFVFAVVHSILARPKVQQPVESTLRGWYRMIYNLQSLAVLLVVVSVGKASLSESNFAALDNDALRLTATAIRFGGIAVMIIAFSTYDIGRFTGVTQIMTGERLGSAETEPLQRHGLNRWVRHPLYTGAFLVLLGGATSHFGLWTAVWGILYFVIGSVFEERKLIKMYGKDYRLYQQEVPRFIPRLGRKTTLVDVKD